MSVFQDTEKKRRGTVSKKGAIPAPRMKQVQVSPSGKRLFLLPPETKRTMTPISHCPFFFPVYQIFGPLYTDRAQMPANRRKVS